MAPMLRLLTITTMNRPVRSSRMTGLRPSRGALQSGLRRSGPPPDEEPVAEAADAEPADVEAADAEAAVAEAVAETVQPEPVDVGWSAESRRRRAADRLRTCHRGLGRRRDHGAGGRGGRWTPRCRTASAEYGQSEYGVQRARDRGCARCRRLRARPA